MTGPRGPTHLTPQTRRAARSARLKREREELNRRVAELRASGAFQIKINRPPAKAPKPREPRPKKKRVWPISRRTWGRALVLMYICQGPFRVRDISATLATDPTTVAQAICELRHLGLLPSQPGRTQTRSAAP